MARRKDRKPEDVRAISLTRKAQVDTVFGNWEPQWTVLVIRIDGEEAVRITVEDLWPGGEIQCHELASRFRLLVRDILCDILTEKP